MLIRPISLSITVFLAIFTFQEAVVNQFNLPGGGFSIFMIFALVWAIASTPEIAAFLGFGAGLLMDLSLSSGGRVGQWTLIMIVVCYGVSYLGYGDENIRGNPVGVVLFVVFASLAAEFLFIVTSLLLGVSVGNFNKILLILLGNFLWTLAITPMALPIFSRLHLNIFETRSSK
jgi:rod shape-determining protein MreD